MHLADDGIAIARLQNAGDTQRVDLLAWQPLSEGVGRAAALAKLVDQYGLRGSRCVCVLDHPSYQLNQVEAPAVDPSELRAAIRWRIKEFIDYHVDDAIVDAFGVPDPRTGTERMLFAVSARTRLVQQVVADVQASGLRLQVIDIRELVLRNLASQVPDQGGGIAFVMLGKSRGTITISRDETLYLARGLDFGSEQLLDSPHVLYESLVLEIQRSLDFYESQLATAPASRILLAPMLAPRAPLLDHLNEQLGVGAYGLDCGQILELGEAYPPELQAQALLALGAAMRQEAVAL